MKIIQAAAELMAQLDGQEILRKIEQYGRVCYKSEDKITDCSASEFVKKLIERGHESVLEHCSFTAKFVCDRGVSHELVRHRLASYSQESTRYCNYSKDQFGREIIVIQPCYLLPETEGYEIWRMCCQRAEATYFLLLDIGYTPQQARAVLPNSLKTEVIMTANLREWRHFFRLRCSPAAHPQMQEVAQLLLDQVREKLPVVFDDILKAGGQDNE